MCIFASSCPFIDESVCVCAGSGICHSPTALAPVPPVEGGWRGRMDREERELRFSFHLCVFAVEAGALVSRWVERAGGIWEGRQSLWQRWHQRNIPSAFACPYGLRASPSPPTWLKGLIAYIRDAASIVCIAAKIINSIYFSHFEQAEHTPRNIRVWLKKPREDGTFSLLCRYCWSEQAGTELSTQLLRKRRRRGETVCWWQRVLWVYVSDAGRLQPEY